MKKSAATVQEALDRHGVPCRVIEMPASTRSARDAAEAIGCEVAQIAKTIVFRKTECDQAVLVIASGTNRVDENKVENLIDHAIEQADPDFVRDATGFAIGGVPPTGHARAIQTFIDVSLLEFSEIWAAAGTPNAVFSLTPEELRLVSGGTAADIALDD